MWRLVARLLGRANGDQLGTDGANAFVSGRYGEAIDKLRRALEMRLEAHARDKLVTILGNAYCELEEYEKAVTAHQQALEINPANHQAWVNLGIAQRRKGAPREAATCYQRAIELKPDYAEAHSSLGAMYIFMDQPDRALDALLRARELDPSGPVTHGNLALALAMLGRFGEADGALKHAVTLGYRNWREVRERIDQLRELDEDFPEEDEEACGPAPEPRWDVGEIAEAESEDFHYVCLGCGDKVEAASVFGEKHTCPACGGNLSRFSAN